MPAIASVSAVSAEKQGLRIPGAVSRLLFPVSRCCLLGLFFLTPLAGCESSDGGQGTTDVALAEEYSCPEAQVTWAATKGTCPLLGRSFELDVSSCEIDITSVGVLAGQAYPDVSWEGGFTSSTDFELTGGPVGWSCSGGWSGASADLTCETEQGSLCVVTFEASCVDIDGVWRITSGMCFDYDTSYTFAQDLSCGLSFEQGDVASSAVPGPATIDGSSVTFDHATHGACVGAVATGSFKGQCDDSCTFEMTKIK